MASKRQSSADTRRAAQSGKPTPPKTRQEASTYSFELEQIRTIKVKIGDIDIRVKPPRAQGSIEITVPAKGVVVKKPPPGGVRGGSNPTSG